MKVVPDHPHFLPAKKAEAPKRSFKEVLREKRTKTEEIQVSPFNLYLQTQMEYRGAEIIEEILHVVTHAIEENRLETQLNVKGTSIYIVNGDGKMHIQLTTTSDQLDLLSQHMGYLNDALKRALPHIQCHLMPLQVHETKNPFKNSKGSDKVRTRWIDGQKKSKV